MVNCKVNSISEISLEPVEWLVEPYLPRGKIVTLIGDQRAGASRTGKGPNSCA